MVNSRSSRANVPLFHKRFRLLKLALERNGNRVKSHSVAGAVGWSTTRQSFAEHDDQPFPLEKLGRLLKQVDPDRSRLGVRLHNEAFWSEALPTFAAAFVEAGLLTESDCTFVKPLPDRLRLLTTSTDLRNLLLEFRTTHADINLFDMAVHEMSRAKQAKQILKLEGLLYDLVLSQPTTRDGAALALRAAEILSRMAFRGYTTGGIRYRSGVDQGKACDWTIEHCLSFVSMKHGEEGPFIEIVKRMIFDAAWRDQDYKHHLRYYGDPLKMAMRTDELLRTRDPRLRASEVGRAIACYGVMVSNPDTLHLAARLKSGALDALKEVGLGKLCRHAERLMP